MNTRVRKGFSVLLSALMLFLLLPAQIILADETTNAANGLIAHYDMSKAGSKLTDVSGNGLDAEYVGFQDSDFVKDQGATVLNFTGDKSKYVKLPKGLINSESFTIETKFTTSTKAAQWLYTLGTKSGTWPNVNNYVFLNPMQGNGSVRFGIKDATTELLFQNATLKSGEYNTFTAAFEPGNITLYLNGELVGNIAHTYSVMDILAAGTDSAANEIGYLGKSLYTPDAAFVGKLADFKVYNYTLSAEEVKQNEALPDELLVEEAKQQLEIPNASDIRGNITLPSTGYKGAQITWATDRPDVVNLNEITNDNYDNMPPGVVTRQDADTQVKLTATLTSGSASATKDITLTVKAKSAKPDLQKYLFTHFTGESATGEQIYFAGSEDGLHWTDLNDGNPVLTSDLGEKGVRDPFIMRSAEGDKFYIIATDLRIASGKGWGMLSRTEANRSSYGNRTIW
ncbi:LamG domain-containing protein [Paenibacillus hexagrammi]|uniref:Atrophied bacterial Ig domain-containing protein n=1 Tax=Paenibacillus hexagrammi TaxID=2908839 RepID=A0ABY3SDX0_9BACL|nr:LamG domain-containing protein [Paenibacillus sp. YPD9-1]UJF31419.1 hypothetical protein L0M14_16455 [Paenibacillus sp. YPD9-1]